MVCLLSRIPSTYGMSRSGNMDLETINPELDSLKTCRNHIASKYKLKELPL